MITVGTPVHKDLESVYARKPPGFSMCPATLTASGTDRRRRPAGGQVPMSDAAWTVRQQLEQRRMNASGSTRMPYGSPYTRTKPSALDDDAVA